MSRTIRRKMTVGQEIAALESYRLENTAANRAELHVDRDRYYYFRFPLKEQYRDFRAKSKLHLYNTVKFGDPEEFIDCHPKASIDSWFFD